MPSVADIANAVRATHGVVVVVVADDGLALAWDGGDAAYDLTAGIAALAALDRHGVRLLWWSARETVPVLTAREVRPGACWDIAAVHRLLHGDARDDAAAVWAAQHGLPSPPPPRDVLDLLDLDQDGDAPIRPDGQLSREWAGGRWRRDLHAARQWACLALEMHASQARALAALPDPRRVPRTPPLPVLTAYAESAASLLAVELGQDGLPFDRDVASALLAPLIGDRPRDDADAALQRRRRDDAVRVLFPHGDGVDLRNPAQVRAMLAGVGFDLPDTRSWRLEPHAATSEPVRELLAWRKAERLATTYGWAWLDRNVGTDGRLRGVWGAAEGAGRMTASAGLHNMPADLRAAVRADDAHVFVRADLGQIEPRVLAAVSGDADLAAAAGEDDLYAPVAAKLRCDRPTAKVAVLAAMYGQTSGVAGSALRDMDRAYPTAMAYLRAAEDAGRRGVDLRTYGGRLLRLRRPLDDARHPPSAWGRFARNAVVQGAAAELFKAWAATVRAGLAGSAGRIVLCLHDELLVHVPAEDAEATRALVETALARTAGWWASGSGVRFVVDVTVASGWAEAH